jgi:hypothetical protein
MITIDSASSLAGERCDQCRQHRRLRQHHQRWHWQPAGGRLKDSGVANALKITVADDDLANTDNAVCRSWCMTPPPAGRRI